MKPNLNLNQYVEEDIWLNQNNLILVNLMVLLFIRDSQHLALREMMHDSKGSLWNSRIGDGRIVLLKMMRIWRCLWLR
ncbi:hypothetical protein MKX03_019135 [Papaver bracteatum]|nr:hypothetical protein MKX03_019135 [Papaver bracteatum]